MERERRKMTQTDLAHALGVANTQVSRWETGAAFPERYLDQLERVLHVRFQLLAEPSNNNGSGTENSNDNGKKPNPQPVGS